MARYATYQNTAVIKCKRSRGSKLQTQKSSHPSNVQLGKDIVSVSDILLNGCNEWIEEIF